MMKWSFVLALLGASAASVVVWSCTTGSYRDPAEIYAGLTPGMSADQVKEQFGTPSDVGRSKVSDELIKFIYRTGEETTTVYFTNEAVSRYSLLRTNPKPLQRNLDQLRKPPAKGTLIQEVLGQYGTPNREGVHSTGRKTFYYESGNLLISLSFKDDRLDRHSAFPIAKP